MHRKLQMVALLALAVLCQQAVGRRPLQVPPSSAGGALGQCTTVYQQLATNPDLSTLKAAVDTAGLRATLDDPGLVATVFAPSNDAFNRTTRDAGTSSTALLQASPQALGDLLRYHIVPGTAVKAADLKAGLRFTALGGGEFGVESQKLKPEQEKYAGCAGLDIHLETYADEDPEPRVCDLPVCGAVLHVVDYVLVPGGAGARALLPGLEFKTTLAG